MSESGHSVRFVTAVSRVCETEMCKLGRASKQKRRLNRFKENKGSNLDIGIIYYAMTGARDRGTKWGRQFVVPEVAA